MKVGKNERKNRQSEQPDSLNITLAGYVRRSSEMQKDNYSIEAQKRGIIDAAKLRGLPEPIFGDRDWAGFRVFSLEVLALLDVFARIEVRRQEKQRASKEVH